MKPLLHGLLIFCGWVQAEPNSVASRYDRTGKWGVEKPSLDWNGTQR